MISSILSIAGRDCFSPEYPQMRKLIPSIRSCLLYTSTVSYERQGTPGKLEFHVLPDEALNFTEGNRVLMRQDDALVFMGYVFSKRRTEEKVIDITAYDQLRYFKNKDIVTYENLTASDVLRLKICDVYGFLPVSYTHLLRMRILRMSFGSTQAVQKRQIPMRMQTIRARGAMI